MKQNNGWVSGPELAEAFGLKSTQRLTDFAAMGMPSRGSGKGKQYPLKKAFAWYLNYSVNAAKRKQEPADFRKARARKMEADARMAEIEVAEAEGQLLRLDEYEKELSRVCERLRGPIMVIPSKYIAAIQITRSDLEAQAVGERIRDELLIALQPAGEYDDEEAEA